MDLKALLGASGGVGHLAVQLAKRMGARVLAVASGADGAEFARRLGADAVIDGRAHDIAEAGRAFAPDGLDAALLTTGGEPAQQVISVMRDGGRVAYPQGVPEPAARDGVEVRSYDGDPGPKVIQELNRLIESDADDLPPFEVHVARTFPLERAADAHRALDEHYLGKLALRLR